MDIPLNKPKQTFSVIFEYKLAFFKYVFTQPLRDEQDVDTESISKWSIADLNSEFSYPRWVGLVSLNNAVCTTIYS